MSDLIGVSYAYMDIYRQAAQDLDDDLAAAAAETTEQSNNNNESSKPQLYNLNEILDALSD